MHESSTKIKYWVPQKANEIVSQHPQYPGTIFYLLLQEFEWQLEPVNSQSIETSASEEKLKHSETNNLLLPQHIHLQRLPRCRSCKHEQDACLVMLSCIE